MAKNLDRRSADHRRTMAHTRGLGRTAACALALALALPAVAVPARAATEAEAAPRLVTVDDLAELSAAQIATANSKTQESFSSGDVFAQVASNLEEDRATRDRLREEARIAAERAAEEERLRIEAEARAEAERLAAEEAARVAEAEAERRAAEERSRAQQNRQQAQQSPQIASVPLSAGADGVVEAAKAQLGVAQDCTDLVQNTLAAVGLTKRRDQGGFDLGTGIWQYDGFGSRVSLDSIAPGDILVYGNAGSGTHVAIYIGDGQAVHGGYQGITKIAGIHTARQALTGAIRPAL